MRQVLLLTLLLITFLSKGQTRTKTGKVLYDDLSPIYEAKIWVYDTLHLGTTDLNGDFKIELPSNLDEVQIGMIGMEIASVKVPHNCDRLEIIMIPAGTYHYRSHKKIDRIRKSLFDRLPELHSNAFDKGLFTTPTPCYGREFKPGKPQLDIIRKELIVLRKEIKESYKRLEIGDTIRIPFSGSYRADGTDRTTLIIWSYVADAKEFECLIEGVVIKKDRRDGGYNFDYKVTNCKACKYDSIIYEERDMINGAIFRHNMKYFKAYTK